MLALEYELYQSLRSATIGYEWELCTSLLKENCYAKQSFSRN
jgi:hypothetical protein